MATIKYKENEQGSKKILLKMDYNNDKQKAYCRCCECNGCGVVSRFYKPVTSLLCEVSVACQDGGLSTSASGSVVLDITDNENCLHVGHWEEIQQDLQCRQISVLLQIMPLFDGEGTCIATLTVGGLSGYYYDLGGVGVPSCNADIYCFDVFDLPMDQLIGTHTGESVTITIS
jgi:hypothetical protein